MPTSTNRTKAAKPAAQAMAPYIEFTAAAHEHVEQGNVDVTQTPGASQIALGTFDIPSYGFLRHVCLQVTCSGGTIGSAALAADAPWNLFSEIALLDTNGAPIFGSMDGYSAMLCSFLGGYAFRQDPALQPDFSNGAITFSFILRIPIEISHNSGLGSLPNQNSSSSYKLRLSYNPASVIWSVAPTAAPAVRTRAWIECWSQPNDVDAAGRPQMQYPPKIGTTQFWSKQNKVTATGDNTVRIDRVGNVFRNLILVFRDNTGARSATVPPDPLALNLDARQLTRLPQQLWRTYMGERFIFSGSLPTGVFVYTFDHDVLGHAGDGTPELFLPTMSSTRLELQGSNFGAAGSIDFLINDVAPAEVTQSQRYVETSATGFHPAV